MTKTTISKMDIDICQYDFSIVNSLFNTVEKHIIKLYYCAIMFS